MVWIVNLTTLIISTIGFGYYYGHSVQPYCRQAKTHAPSFKKCGDFRLISGIFETIIFLNYLVFFVVPVPRVPNILEHENLAYFIGFPLFILGILIMILSIKIAGSETLKPKEDTPMFKGIYQYIRHPQTTGTLIVWFGLAFASNRMFLILYTIILSLVYIYVTYLEEDDLIIKYGDDYLKYREKTGRFLPKIKK